MASRRVAASAVDWAEFAKKIPEAQKASFQALKNKTDGYVRRIAQLPEKPPALDWAGYKEKIAVPGMVDTFQKRWEALQIPYPKDTLAPQIEQQAAEQKSAYDKFVGESKTRIEGINKEKAKWEAMMPVEEMTMEEALASGFGNPVGSHHLVVDPTNPYMTFWPHKEDYYEWKKEIEEIKQLPEEDNH